MKYFFFFIFLSLLGSNNLFAQKPNIDSAHSDLIGLYDYCATFNSSWQMVSDTNISYEGIADNHILFRGCYHLDISKIKTAEFKYLHENSSKFVADTNLFLGLEIFIGCKGGTQYLYSSNRDELYINEQKVLFKNEYLFAIGHFIYFGIEVQGELFWYKYIKIYR